MAVPTDAQRAPALVLLLAAASGCDGEPPPRSVGELMDNPILLEAAVVRCAANRRETRYDEECVNAREAVKRVDAAKAKARRAELEAQSERERQRLRRAQQATAEAHRLAVEEQRRREEAAYLAQFGESPPAVTDSAVSGDLAGNVPGTVSPEANAPAAEPAADAAPVDLEAIREELRQRGEQDRP